MHKRSGPVPQVVITHGCQTCSHSLSVFAELSPLTRSPALILMLYQLMAYADMVDC